MAAYLSVVSLLLTDSKILLLKRPKVDSLHPRLLLEDSHQEKKKSKDCFKLCLHNLHGCLWCKWEGWPR